MKVHTLKSKNICYNKFHLTVKEGHTQGTIENKKVVQEFGKGYLLVDKDRCIRPQEKGGKRQNH